MCLLSFREKAPNEVIDYASVLGHVNLLQLLFSFGHCHLTRLSSVPRPLGFFYILNSFRPCCVLFISCLMIDGTEMLAFDDSLISTNMVNEAIAFSIVSNLVLVLALTCRRDGSVLKRHGWR